MAKRRSSQTSVTVWLDPEEVERLDSLRADAESRSGWAAAQIRRLISENRKPGRSASRALEAPRADGVRRPAQNAYRPGMLDPRIVETAILRLRATRHARPGQPTIPVRELANAVRQAREGADLPMLARRYGCSSTVLAREVAAVEEELKRWSA